MRFALEPSQVAAQLVVHALDLAGVGLAFDVLAGREDRAVALPVVGAEGDFSAARKLRTQRSGCPGVTIAQRPAENLSGSAINSPPQPNCSFF